MSDQPTTGFDDPVDDEPQRSSRALPLLLGLLVGVLVLGGGYVLLIGFGDDDLEEPIPSAAADRQDDDVVDDAVVDELADGTDDAGVVTVPTMVTHEVFLSRDPFERVVPEDETATATSDGGDSTGDGTADDGTADGTADDGTADGTGDDGTGDDTTDGTGEPTQPSGDGCTGVQELVCDGHVVTLIDTTTVGGEDVAVIQVDTTVYEVQRGQRFAEFFELRAIDGSCVSLLYGDDGFQLCRGDRVLK